jgi:hypothetical protein
MVHCVVRLAYRGDADEHSSISFLAMEGKIMPIIIASTQEIAEMQRRAAGCADFALKGMFRETRRPIVSAPR